MTTAIATDEAKQAADDASRKVTELESAVLAGDTSITASALSKARQEAEFASLKVVAAQRGVDQEAKDAHDAAVTTLRADYEDHVEDLDELREAYQWAVIAVAELHQAIDKRQAASRALVSRGYALGLVSRSDTTGGPFPEDRARWGRNNVGAEFVSKAVEEGTRGFLRNPFANKAIVHTLHTDERRAQLETITGLDLDGQAKDLLAEFVAAHQD
ncbi:hypothetical protein HQP42_08995 [Rhodococcus fascians]|jgi:hypothetical protein|nr:hypothetical protein [Rhodococcus fascians]MBY3825492.1 hypothetical protein [Rhodococcus fascians]MBY3835954.1 hypothetical protein [Rhodococcus fascians]MBY3865166.1 hypothetical protein [Rhodococcus fascians]MBY3884432.1 hypothetical protein [Rhodococcus fascians]